MSTLPNPQTMMPDIFPGPKGRTLKVVRAIVKVYVKAHDYGKVKAPDSYIVRCGNAPRGCRGILGYPDNGSDALFGVFTSDRLDVGWEKEGIWVLTHPDKYRGNPGGGYFVLDPTKGRRDREGRKTGARRPPGAIHTAREAAYEAAGWAGKEIAPYPDPPELDLTDLGQVRRFLDDPAYQLVDMANLPPDDVIQAERRQEETDAATALARMPRPIVGQFPEPPCVVFCPQCGMPNWVESPPVAPPPGHGL